MKVELFYLAVNLVLMALSAVRWNPRSHQRQPRKQPSRLQLRPQPQHLPLGRTSCLSHVDFFWRTWRVSKLKRFLKIYLRLLFPTLQKNESPFAILPQWLSVLGKKIDSAATTQDHKWSELKHQDQWQKKLSIKHIFYFPFTLGEAGGKGNPQGNWVFQLHAIGSMTFLIHHCRNAYIT